jgi:PKD repeat protein
MLYILMILTAFSFLIPSSAMAQNNPPIADAGPDQDIFVDQGTVLSGSATDPDGDTIVDWLWTVETSPADSNPFISEPDSPDPVFSGDLVGDYVLSLIASDGTDWSEPDFVTIHVSEILPPVAVAEADVTSGPAPLTVSFDGSQSYDPQGGELMYRWYFGDSSPSSDEVSPNHVYQFPGTYVAELWVLDSRAESDVAAITITVGCLAVSPIVHDYGDVELGLSSSMIFTVSNVCKSSGISVSDINLDVDSSPDFTITNAPQLPLILYLGDTVDVEVTFSPTVTEYQDAGLIIQSDDNNSIITVPINGMGVEVEPPPANVEIILAEFDESGADGSLVGNGNGNSANGRRGALRNMIEAIDDLIEDGDLEGACQQLTDAYNRCDGLPKPPDFVAGSSASELASMLMQLKNNLGCE